MPTKEDPKSSRDLKSSIYQHRELYNSYYDQRSHEFVLARVKFLALTVLTLGFAYPWAMCNKQRGVKSHTIICGRRLKFIGDPHELLAHWIIWWILSIITIGIFGFFAKVRMQRWVIANTVFDDTYVYDTKHLIAIPSIRRKIQALRKKSAEDGISEEDEEHLEEELILEEELRLKGKGVSEEELETAEEEYLSEHEGLSEEDLASMEDYILEHEHDAAHEHAAANEHDDAHEPEDDKA